MKKFRAILFLVVLGLLLIVMGGCVGESPESLFETAQFEEKQTNFEHARQLYEQIIRDHPDSEWAKKAKERLEALSKSVGP